MPKNAASIAPTIIDSIKGEMELKEESDRVFARVNNDTIRVTIVTAKFSGTDCFAVYLRGPFKTGSLYSAPPNPIKPPTIAIGIEIRNANQGLLEICGEVDALLPFSSKKKANQQILWVIFAKASLRRFK